MRPSSGLCGSKLGSISINSDYPVILDRMNTMLRILRRTLNLLGLRLLGFAWMGLAALLIAIGIGVGLLGIAGGILVRARPDTNNVINYDPSRIASFAPVPFVLGLLLTALYLYRARKLGR